MFKALKVMSLVIPAMKSNIFCQLSSYIKVKFLVHEYKVVSLMTPYLTIATAFWTFENKITKKLIGI